MIVARQFIAWNTFQSRIRPVGHGLILTPGCLIVLIVARLSDPIIPCPTGRFAFFARIPGNKLPGYYHPVPTGRPGRAGARPYRALQASSAWAVPGLAGFHPRPRLYRRLLDSTKTFSARAKNKTSPPTPVNPTPPKSSTNHT